MSKIEQIKNMIFNNRKVIENYFFMTILSVLNSFFGLFIYPYIIKALGAEQYGKYVFVFSVVSYFVNFISFGFDMIALKSVVENENDIEKKSETLSIVYTSRFYLQILSIVLYTVLLLCIPSFREDYLLHGSVFLMTLATVLFPNWYFQAIQKMKWVTMIQFLCKLISLPFIFYFVKTEKDLVSYALIITISGVLGSVLSVIVLLVYEKVKLRFMKFSTLKQWYKEAFPLFLTSSIGILKEQGAVIIIGSFFGMREVAIYDLANKVISIPRLLFTNINAAIFPKLFQDINVEKVKKIIRYEYLIGGVVAFLVVAFGYWAILLLGGRAMVEAYLLLVVISPTIVTWLVVGAYIYFVFLPNKLNYLITKNQLLAMSSFFIFTSVGILVSDKIIVLCMAMMLSGLAEIFYCIYLTKKKRLL